MLYYVTAEPWSVFAAAGSQTVRYMISMAFGAWIVLAEFWTWIWSEPL